MALVKIKNISGAEGTWNGQTIADGGYYKIPASERNEWVGNEQVFDDIANGVLLVNDGVNDITSALDGWQLIQGIQNMPLSRHLEGKIAVHASSKPEPSGIITFAVWTGCGDDITEPDENLSLGAGDLLSFDVTQGSPIVYKDVHFDPRHGRTWIHEAYVKFNGGGVLDYLTADIIAPASQLQQVANLDYIVEDNWVKYSPGGPGTGTHGLADIPLLIPRSYSKDGDWDYDGTNLTPNFTGTGGYNISDIEKRIHRYFNKIPLYGTSSTYFTMSSEETAELLPRYFVRIEAHNISDTNWNLSIIMEIYREKTICS